MPWTRIDPWPQGIELLRDAGLTIAAMALSDDSVSLDDLEAARPSASRSSSGPRATASRPARSRPPTLTVRIPMAGGVDSLNVAAAAPSRCGSLRLRD